MRFAELSTTDLSVGNAAHVYALAGELLHFSPEPRVVEKRIESALLLGHETEADLYIARYKAAFPKEHAKWENLRLFASPAASAPSAVAPP